MLTIQPNKRAGNQIGSGSFHIFKEYYFAFSNAALTKSRNNGCGRVGRDVNSGWNCEATNQGWSASSMISTNLPSGLVPEKMKPASSIWSLK
jgi:hypothetical protein